MTLRTALTDKLQLKCPIISAPMAGASGGRLAAEVTRGGGLGLIGAGYGEEAFIEQAWQDADNENVGIGFITWSLAKNPELLDMALVHNPKAVMLSFGDPSPFANKIMDAGATLICQCQTISHVSQALDNGAEIIVAQGGEAGGHGAKRGTMAFVPEAADFIAKRNSDAILVAAGGIGDGRGIAASLMLGAQGVLLGSRYWATREALVPQAFQNAALAACGDDTMRTSVPDVARKLHWPQEFNIRVLANKLMTEFDARVNDLDEAQCTQIARRYLAAAQSGDIDDGGIIVGEIAGIINAIPGAKELTHQMGQEAKSLLENFR